MSGFSQNKHHRNKDESHWTPHANVLQKENVWLDLSMRFEKIIQIIQVTFLFLSRR